jgi:hypothetical protein
MKRSLAVTLFLVLATQAAFAQDGARTVENGAQFDAYLRRCFQPPAGSAGSEITLLFTLDQDGRLKGKPRITYSKLVGDVQTQKDFVAAALAMLQNCTPVPVTKEFGLMAANKMRAWRLTASDSNKGGSI